MSSSRVGCCSSLLRLLRCCHSCCSADAASCFGCSRLARRAAAAAGEARPGKRRGLTPLGPRLWGTIRRGKPTNPPQANKGGGMCTAGKSGPGPSGRGAAGLGLFVRSGLSTGAVEPKPERIVAADRSSICKGRCDCWHCSFGSCARILAWEEKGFCVKAQHT